MNMLFNYSQLTQVAQQLWTEGAASPVWAIFAPMGAGKTTLTAAVLAVAGVADPISSPTYSIINQYADATGAIVYHMDWYRLKDEEDAIGAGVEDALYSGNRCIIEWPERIPHILPNNTFCIYIEPTTNDQRHIYTKWIHE